MVAALGMTVEPSNINCEPFEAKSKHYLERMGLFKLLKIETGMMITEHDSSGRFIPLTTITNSETLGTVIVDMIPLLHLEPKHVEPIKYIVSELVRNVLEHSGSETGATLCAQYYKKSKTIRIGIADTGVGIKETINMSHNAPTDMEGIRLALTPGITGTTSMDGGTEYNAGAGLFFIKSIAKVNRDFFMIYSGSAMYKLLKTNEITKHVRLYVDPFMDRHSKEEQLSFWKGTVVGIDLTLEKSHEFSILLDLIRRTYRNAMKERRRARYRRPRFV